MNSFARIGAACLAAVWFAVAASAARASWGPEPLTLTGAGTFTSLMSDGADGVVVCWSDGSTYRLLRLGPDGDVAPGWTAGGLPVSGGALQGCVEDGAGGAYLVSQLTEYQYVGTQWVARITRRAWHVDGSGAFAPGYPDTGLVLGTYSGASAGSAWFAAHDGVDGAYVVRRVANYMGDGVTWYADDFPGVHLRPNGVRNGCYAGSTNNYFGGGVGIDGLAGLLNVQSWDTDFRAGRSDRSGGYTSFLLSTRTLGDPGSAGVIGIPGSSDHLVWWRQGTWVPPDTNTYRVTRLDSLQHVRAGWPAGKAFANLPFRGDGSGGLFVAVQRDVRRLQRVNLDQPAPVLLWNDDALPPYRTGMTALDGSGGLFNVWNLGGPTTWELRAAHINGAGQIPAAWGENGVLVSAAASTPWAVAPAGPGRAVVAWTEGTAIRLQLLADDAPVPAAASLVSAEAFADRVALAWRVPAAGPFAVERRVADDAAWVRVGDAMAAGADAWVFEDHDIMPGDSYAYRLVASDGALPGSEARVQVPGLAFALRGFVTNPGADALEFTLPDAARATLDVFDVTGRRLAHREVGALGAGTHRVTLPELRAARAGLVFARLARGGEVRMARGTRLN